MGRTHVSGTHTKISFWCEMPLNVKLADGLAGHKRSFRPYPPRAPCCAFSHR